MAVRALAIVIQDTRRPKKDGSFPLKLRITYNREQRYYPIGIDLTEDDFQKARGSRPRGEALAMKSRLESYEAKARTTIDNMPLFSFGAFEKLFSGPQRSKECVFSRYLTTIEAMEEEGRQKTAYSYKDALHSLQAFHNRAILPFSEVTVDFLKAYEGWMLKPRMRQNGSRSTVRANSVTTVGMYLRTLRAIINQAISLGDLSADVYPFGKRGYQIPASQNTKKALSTNDLKKLFAYEYPGDHRSEFYRDIWLFSYLCNGTNMKDVARLRYANIDGNSIEFIRSKTETSTRRSRKAITVHLLPEANAIIEKWGNKPKHRDTHVFPILPEFADPKKEVAIISQLVKMVNANILKITKEVGIQQHVTTYTARHSFATVLKRSNAPTSFIQEALGHKNSKTTENYLDSFEDDARKNWAGNLTEFLE